MFFRRSVGYRVAYVSVSIHFLLLLRSVLLAFFYFLSLLVSLYFYSVPIDWSVMVIVLLLINGCLVGQHLLQRSLMRFKATRSSFMSQINYRWSFQWIYLGKRLLHWVLCRGRWNTNVQIAAASSLHAEMHVSVEPLHALMLLLSTTQRRLVWLISTRGN